VGKALFEFGSVHLRNLRRKSKAQDVFVVQQPLEGAEEVLVVLAWVGCTIAFVITI
jgi:hypothetical protein